MKVTKQNSEERRIRISQVLETIRKCFSDYDFFVYDKLVNQISFTLNVARRTSREYLDVALTQIDHVAFGKGKNLEIHKPNYDGVFAPLEPNDAYPEKVSPEASK